MLSKSEKHNTNLDLAAVLLPDGQRAAAMQEHTEPVNSSSIPAERLKKKHDSSHGVVPSRKQEDSLLVQTVATPSVVHDSLWNNYNELYCVQFGNGPYFPVARHIELQPDGTSLCLVKQFSGADAEECIHAIRRIKHHQFVQAQNLFHIENELSVAFEYMPMSLAEVEGNPLLDDLLLASILGQVVDGLLYLEKNSLGHGNLTCSNILVDMRGNVKIWGHEFLHDQFDLKETLHSIAVITMRLIQGYAKEDGRIGLDIPDRCPLGFDFLSALDQMKSIEDLKKHPLLKQHWHSGWLDGLGSLVIMWCSRGYKIYPRVKFI